MQVCRTQLKKRRGPSEQRIPPFSPAGRMRRETKHTKGSGRFTYKDGLDFGTV